MKCGEGKGTQSIGHRRKLTRVRTKAAPSEPEIVQATEKYIKVLDENSKGLSEDKNLLSLVISALVTIKLLFLIF